MNRVFADTAFFVAVLSQRDVHLAEADRFSREYRGRIVTSHWVMLEVANYFAASRNRTVVVEFLDAVLADREMECVRTEAELFDSGWHLYRSRPDKEWSLTDCISFEIMRRRSIPAALTADRHFEQAGFQVLLK